MTGDDKYSLLNRDNLMQPMRTELSQKQKTVSQIFLPFWKCTLKCEHCRKKDDRHS